MAPLERERETFPAFPFEPYDVQKDLMRAVYRTLEHGGVGVLESPTGTGKTLSLLCSSLQWLVDRREEEEEEGDRGDLVAEGESSESENPDWIKDFEEEKRNSRLVKRVPAPRATAVRDRERLLAGKQSSVSAHWGGKASNGARPGAAQASEGGEEDLADLEEEFLIEDGGGEKGEAGKRKFPVDLDDESESESSDTEPERLHRQIFYCSRTHSQLSQVVKELRGTSLASQVSASILGSRKGLCVNEKVARLKTISRINEQCIQLQQKRSGKKAKGAKGGCSKGCPYFQKKGKQAKLVRRILSSPMDIEDIGVAAKKIEACGYYAARKAALDADIVFLPYNTVLSKSVRETSGVRVKDSVVIIDEAHNVADAVNNMHSVVLSLVQVKTAKRQVLVYYNRFKNMFSPTNGRNVQMILRLADALSKCFEAASREGQSSRIVTVNEFLSETGIDNINIFKLSEFVRESKLFFKVSGYSEVLASQNEGGDTGDVEKLGALNSVMDLLFALTNNEEDGRVIVDKGAEQVKFVMLNAATHFENLVQEAHAVLLVGGTLAPLDDLFLQVMPTVNREEVRTLSCGHVINRKNLLTLTIPKGPTGKDFDFVHSKRSSEDMMMDLGRLVVNACKVVPDGVVCFFPSYKYSEEVTALWSSRGIMDQIGQKKRVFGEPKAADEVEGVLSKYKSQIESEDDAAGAILFCVVGGKMSEGINFSDRLGRCVILAGLPYPNIYDQELSERLRYLDEISRKVNPAGGSGGGGSATREHMENICMKAVNQTIGRAIRHRGDYACIILADRRYCSESGGPFRKLPDWIKEAEVAHCESFGKLFRNLVGFFRK
ncbi:DNA repair helicase [Chloropicon primus]|uniref:DNA repair helicase n=2 Tax=Chloropicon primus TaxID=1764295 RepID=A0A5B8MRF8_9CHLO|nr:DNA repair helicase [Chloropicon primus]|eukprot:QDZ21842.1 DNA repair helicase [Chloropicon primus]